MIHARALTKKFGQFVAVDTIELEMGTRGLVGFLGPNGAGKTTTMRMFTGALPMTSGTVEVAGYDVFDHPLEVKARVGYLPESPPLYPELSVGEYLRFVADLRGVPRAKRLKVIGESMERVGLSGWEDRLTGSLSKGYRQRVGLAQALLHDPKVLILDEPTSGLDPAQLVGIRRMIRELAQDKLVVLSTHILQEVEMLCERVIMINRGRIVGDGQVDALATQVGAGPWLELRVRGASEALVSVLTSIDAVSKVRVLESEVPGVDVLRIEGPEDLAQAISERVHQEGWSIEAMIPRQARLEEVFLSLVEAE